MATDRQSAQDSQNVVADARTNEAARQGYHITDWLAPGLGDKGYFQGVMGQDLYGRMSSARKDFGGGEWGVPMELWNQIGPRIPKSHGGAISEFLTGPPMLALAGLSLPFMASLGLAGAAGAAGGAGGGEMAAGAFDMGGLSGTGIPEAWGAGAGPGAGAGAESFVDVWDVMGDKSAYGLGGGGGGAASGGSFGGIKDIYNAIAPYKGLLDVGQGLYGMYQGSQMRDLAAPGIAAAEQYTSLSRNPSSVTSLPGYQELLKQRIEAARRAKAAAGLNLSGSELASLAQLGGDQFLQYYGSEMDRSGKMAQSAQGPRTAASQLDANSLNRILYGLSRL